MFVKSKIPKIIYTAFSPSIPIPKKVDKLKSLLRREFHLEKSVENKEPSQQASAQKAHDEHIKNRMRNKEETKDIMDQLVKKSNRKILSIHSFSFFPSMSKNTIEIEESRVIFIFKQPFTFQSHSVDISDISNIFIQSAFFFANIQIISRTFTENNITIGYLNKSEANKARRIIEGLKTFARAKIDTSVYETDELIKKIEELHATR